MFVFAAFVLIRLHSYNNMGIVLIRTLVFVVLLIIGYFAVSIGIHVLLLLLSGLWNFQIICPHRPKQPLQP